MNLERILGSLLTNRFRSARPRPTLSRLGTGRGAGWAS